MNIVINIGNTNISLARAQAGLVQGVTSFPNRSAGLAKLLAQVSRGKPPSRVLVCSVVPELTARVERACRQAWKVTPMVVGRDIAVPLKNRYRDAKALGQDRLVNAYAATVLFGAPSVSIDFGTAITFDVVSRNKEYMGGMIIPGVQASFDALGGRTALLPALKAAPPREFIGRDTASGIKSGVVHGAAAVADSLVARIKSEATGPGTAVIATGGDAALMARYCRSFSAVEGQLTLKGLALLLEGRKA